MTNVVSTAYITRPRIYALQNQTRVHSRQNFEDVAGGGRAVE